MTFNIGQQLSGSILHPNNNWDISVQRGLSELKTPDYLIHQELTYCKAIYQENGSNGLLISL